MVVYNPYLVIPVATYAVAQITKFAIEAFRGDINFHNLYASGGMPSVHTAFVTSLTTTALLVGGADSPLFGVTACLAAIVIYDSLGVRRSTGEQSVALNMVLDGLEDSRIKLERPNLRVHEALGHNLPEVVAGGTLGILLAGLFNYGKLGPLANWAEVTPRHLELWFYSAIFGVLIIAGVVTKLVLDAKYPKSKVIKRFTRQLLTFSQTIGWLGVISVIFSYERASYAGWRVWSVGLIAAGIIWAGLIFVGSYKRVPQGLAIEQHEARKLKWLNFGKKRRK